MLISVSHRRTSALNSCLFKIFMEQITITWLARGSTGAETWAVPNTPLIYKIEPTVNFIFILSIGNHFNLFLVLGKSKQFNVCAWFTRIFLNTDATTWCSRLKNTILKKGYTECYLLMKKPCLAGVYILEPRRCSWTTTRFSEQMIINLRRTRVISPRDISRNPRLDNKVTYKHVRRYS